MALKEVQESANEGASLTALHKRKYSSAGDNLCFLLGESNANFFAVIEWCGWNVRHIDLIQE